MPQMMTSNWMFLMLFFIMIFFMFNIFIYINFIKMNSSLKVNLKKKFIENDTNLFSTTKFYLIHMKNLKSSLN